jgi:hypothetical protein
VCEHAKVNHDFNSKLCESRKILCYLMINNHFIRYERHEFGYLILLNEFLNFVTCHFAILYLTKIVFDQNGRFEPSPRRF